MAALKKGQRSIRFDYFQFNSAVGLKLEWEGENLARQILPANRLSH